jgi:hypothetical protein
MGRAARALYESNAGSTDRALQIIDKYLQAKAAPGSLHSVKATLREKGD